MQSPIQKHRFLYTNTFQQQIAHQIKQGRRLTCNCRMVSPPLPMMRPTLVPGIDISSTELPSGPPPPPPPPPPPMPSKWGWLPRSIICWISCLHTLHKSMKPGIRPQTQVIGNSYTAQQVNEIRNQTPDPGDRQSIQCTRNQ